MSQDWLLAVNLGSFAMAGIGLLFVVLWSVDRDRNNALVFAGSIGCYIAGTVALSVGLPAALASSIHGVLFPAAMLLLADGLLRRVGDRVPRALVLTYLLPMVVIVWFFAYVSQLLVGRVVSQNLLTALLMLVVVRRLWERMPRTGPNWAALAATAVFGFALGIAVIVAPFSPIPRELLTRADLDIYMRTGLELCLIVSSTIVLPSLMVMMLAVTVIDIARELRSQRDCDELTGLLNRRGFNRRAEAMLRTAERAALVVADLDHFKAVNDTAGHSGGDKVLIAFARILTDSVDGRQLVGRIGGEEFAVLLAGTGLDDAVGWAETIRTRVAAHAVDLSGEITSVTASFGIASGDRQSQLTDLVEAADKALYKAKAAGRNQISIGQ
ncbi:GGDEF domain-containing protein [Mycolicibacterium mucogenicum]|uniref:GGDEF domain-containing protein n=1 Tax=Mycolicibacterium mucogenicum TaxID=56689 RepID=UPI002269AC79|nr:GGDEF domain-containing protein [Mycolicibacterium mucogenicum]MCX8560555.1 GGDEF domain-containing protein [Mycolicibacterium mucogenicum]